MAEEGPFIHAEGCSMVSQWFGGFLNTLKIESPNDLLTVQCLKVASSVEHGDSCASIFSAELFTTVKKGTCPGAYLHMVQKKMWHLYTVGFYSAVLMNEMSDFPWKMNGTED